MHRGLEPVVNCANVKLYKMVNAPSGVILDTNVVLDWMLFGNRECSPLIAAIERGALQWWASPSLQAGI